MLKYLTLFVTRFKKCYFKKKIIKFGQLGADVCSIQKKRIDNLFLEIGLKEKQESFSTNLFTSIKTRSLIQSITLPAMFTFACWDYLTYKITSKTYLNGTTLSTNTNANI